MDKSKIAADLVTEENFEQQDAAKAEIRTLSDLELVLCGGGEDHVNW